ncbi:MAG: hypothetical protein KatS3mg108_2806 [Isosphaeraceae bacterium]|jgi:hypothetical protein|nr:MAG: hypothetical protein KatS3mg108_2806 [Isosphaeraceae bacterium]
MSRPRGIALSIEGCRWARLAGGLLLGSMPALVGCGREFFREWADQDVTEAVFEKSRDPRWRLPVFTVDPPAMSRFADYSDPDRPPAPPDDPATEALSPYPQKPHMRLLVPMEGTGYLDLLEQGPRYEPPPPEEGKRQEAVEIPPLEGESPPPPTGSTPPFGPPPGAVVPPGGLPPLPVPGGGAGAARAPGAAGTRAGLAGGSENAGTRPVATTPSSIEALGNRPKPAQMAQAAQVRASTSSASSSRDPQVQATAYQQPEAPPVVPGANEDPLRIREQPGRVQDPTEPGGALGTQGPGPLVVDPNAPPITRPGLTPDQARAVRAGTAGFAAQLSRVSLDVNHAQLAGLPSDSRPYVMNPAQALQLGLINSRPYQFRLESVYLQSLAVTLQRFGFQPQFYAGISPVTSPGQGFPPGAGGGFPQGGTGINQFVYRTSLAPGGQASTLSLSEAAGFGKLFVFGGRLLAGFANNTVFNFVGANPRQPSVQSSLPLSFVQPFLRNGGRAVTLEPLTQAERTLLYEVRSFARFRQQFFVSILASAQGGAVSLDNPGTTEPTIGYLQLLQLYQQAENTRINIAAFERALEIFSEYARGGASSGISQLQVDQIDQQRQQATVQLIQQQTQYRNQLDQYKRQLGMPPDVPLVPDLGLLMPFRRVQEQIIDWSADPDHKVEDLPVILSGLPTLPNIVLDGRPLFDQSGPRPRAAYGDSERLEEFLLTAERIALENRLDLMNARATLYDVWRQLAVTSNALLPFFNVQLNYQLLTPAATSNPFAFDSRSNQFNVSINAEPPLIRVAERNNFRTALINYQRARRLLMNQEDQVKFEVRQEIRNLIQFAEQYEVTKTQIVLLLRQRDQALQQLIAPPDQGAGAGGFNPNLAASQATQTLNFIQSLNNILVQQNSLIQLWVNYQSLRLALYRDLGIMPFDEWEAYYELFASNPDVDTDRNGRPGDLPPLDRPAPAEAGGGS